jgi:predicted phosphodiesterase
MANTPRVATTRTVRTRLGVIGDIHTERSTLSWALGVLAEQQVEHVLSTGDIADGPHDAQGVEHACKLLREVDAITVLGNHDRWMLDSTMRDFPNATFVDELGADTLAYLRALPITAEIETPDGLLLLGHGLGADDMGALYPHDRGPELTNNTALQAILRDKRHRYVVGGHTHRRMVRTIEGVTFINAGAIKETREPCCVVLDFTLGTAQFHDYVAGKTVLGPSFPLKP